MRVAQMGYITTKKRVRWVRLVVPDDLVPVIGKKNLMESLETKDSRAATERAPAVIAKFQHQHEGQRTVRHKSNLGDQTTNVRVNKMDVARRQLDAAIRMTFGGEDPIAIHTVAAAGHRIVRDICKSRGNIEGYRHFTGWLAPGQEKKFWKAINRSANFFKHADNDANTIHEMDENETDFLIVLASKWYGDLGFTQSVEMRSFAAWFAMCHPKTFTPAARAAVKCGALAAQFDTMSNKLRQLPRKDRLRVGQISLTQNIKPNFAEQKGRI
jgi:Domain of unknown function (DUF6538)